MKVILSQDVPNVGKMGATVNVADGFARNYLLPRKLAVGANSASAKQIEHELRIIRKREEKRRAILMEMAKKLEGVTVEIKARAGEEEKIFGSVTAAHIAEKLGEMGFDVDRKIIALEEPIKSLGIFGVPVKLASGIEATVKVWVSAIEEETAAE
ncbi:MAG TPA: 50S ribosomal protein L9 [Candidatus Hydrogenedentes bacterium]|nr:50S ribosomal protein L9 [Candidatus Hydrogenedentota bacterium]HOT52110.1 50S ribosomal protein L9 [Candidatus Hydrogenedentota bacterium]HOV73039.1 50S ribosomal protein L9 [Candidatus Hydrogenedentota bacterium]HPC14785.1 50S ribosomal protein L9 [Candidatus Hydrogenedentota bacterium]HRT18649.1 50S ribosomal protein L9 [Candidatus Hydrogenedentota bacterium]